MNWPLSQDYNEAIQNPASCFSDPDLKAGEVPAGPLGIPVPRSGNFADVYQLRGGDGSVWAIKCFTRKVTGLRERYAQIDEHLRKQNLPFTVGFQYQEEGIRVRNQWFPIVKMEWVEGFTLNEFVRDNLEKPHVLQALLGVWCRLSKRLRDSEIAHADLQHGNVLLVPGFTPAKLGLKLIDYDGMWIPSLAGKNSGEVGHANYQHPLRASNRIFGPDVDRFPHLVIATALRGTILGGEELWKAFDNGDNLLFRESDFLEPAKSPLLKKLASFKDPTLNALLANLVINARKPLDKAPWLDLILPEEKPAVLTPIQEKEASQTLGYSLQKKSTETTKALSTAVAKPVAAGDVGWNQAQAKPAPDSVPAFAALTAKPGEALQRKGSRLPLIVGGLVSIAMLVISLIIFTNKKNAEDLSKKSDPAKDKTELVKNDKDEKEKSDSPKKKDDIAVAPPKETPPPKKDEVKTVPTQLVGVQFNPQPAPETNAKQVRVLTDGTLAVLDSASPPVIKILDLIKGGEPVSIKLPADQNFTAFAFSNDRTKLALADDKGEVSLIDPASGQNLRKINETSQPVAGLAFSNDDKWLFFGNRQTDEVEKVNCDTGMVTRNAILIPDKKFPKPKGIADVRAAREGDTVYIQMKTSVHTLNFNPKGGTWWAFASPVRSIAMSQNANLRFAMLDKASNPESLLLSTESAEKVRLDSPPIDLHDCFMDPEGKFLGGLSEKTLLLYETARGKLLGKYEASEPLIWADVLDAKSIVAQKKSGGLLALGMQKLLSDNLLAEQNYSREFKKLFSLPGEASWNCLDFTFDNSELFFGNNQGPNIQGYNLITRTKIADWSAGKVFCLRTSANGQILAQTSPSVAKLWDANGENMELLSFPAEVCAVVRPAGRGHVIGGAIDGKIHYVVPDSNGRTGSFPHHGPIKIRAIDITPSGNILASVCDNGEIIIGTYPQSTVRIGLGETQGITFKIALSPDAGTVLSYGLDNTVQIWDTFTRGRKFKLEAHTEPVIDARFTPDGQYIVTVAKDNTLRLWNANNGTELQKITLPASPNGLTISKDSRLLATALGEGKSAQIILWSLPSPAQAIFTSKIAIPSRDPANPGDPGMNNANRMTAGLGRVFTTGVEPDSIRNIGYTGDGKKFVLVRRNGSVVIYDAETMKLLDTMEVDKECTAAALIGDLLFIANADNHLKYFDLGTQKLVKEFEPTKTTIRGIYPYSDQRTILCRDDAGFFSLIYGTAGNKPRHYATPINYAGPDPSRISLAPTTRRAYGIDGNHLISWAADDGSARKVVAEFDGIIQSFAISPQGTRITGVTANSISTSDANGKLVAKILMRLGGLPADPPHGLQFIDGGRKIVGASYKGGVRVWDIAKGTLLQSLPGEFFSYEMSAVSPDGKLFAMISGLKLGGDNTMNVRNQLSIWRLVDDKKK